MAARKTLTVRTSQTAVDALAPAVRRHVATAYAALSALEPSPARIRRAAAAVGALRNDGMSVRGIVAHLSVQGAGTLPTGKGTIERMGYVADAINPERDAKGGIVAAWPAADENTDGILMALYRIAQSGTKADVSRAAAAGRRAKDGAAAYDAVDAIRRALNATEHAALTAKPARPVAGEAADGGKGKGDTDTDKSEGKGSSTRTPADVSKELGRYTLTSLLSECVRRAQADNFYADDEISALIATLAERAEVATVIELIDETA